MKISKYFSLDEFTRSELAKRKKINNIPSVDILKNIVKTANFADEVRELLNNKIIVSSGFRCSELNAAVGSKPTSAHVYGYALDFSSPDFGTVDDVFNALLKSKIKFDQCILEKPKSKDGWVHLSFAPAMRCNFLKFNGSNYELVKK